MNNLKNVGGKAQGLMALARQFRIPPGFVITPDEVLDQAAISGYAKDLGGTVFAVRSSAMNEDGQHAAWAGQFETKLNVHLLDIVDAVKSCRQSANSQRVHAYGTARNEAAGDIAVIVQVMIPSRISGVAFSRHPVTGASQVVIEAVRGCGEQLVSGQVTPDMYVVAEEIEVHAVDDARIMNDREIRDIAALANRAQAVLGYPVNIEWAYEGTTAYLLQARPITTL